MKSKIKINIKGKNIERFIKRLYKNGIEIISAERIKYNEMDIIIYLYDLNKVNDLKTIYEIEIKRKYGFIHLKELININKYLLSFIIVGVVLIYTLSNMIFSIDVIHNDRELRDMLKNELKKYGITKYHFKKKYKEIEKIKKDILNNHKDTIEWMEIIDDGVKYIVKVEERIKNKEEEKNENKNVVARKDGVIISVEASHGEIKKFKNDYVKKGDIIISGDIMLNDEIKNTVGASGKVFAETWYTVSINYPFHYKEIKYTKNKKKVLSFKLLNKYYEIFNFNKFKTKKSKDNILIENKFIPLKFIYQEQIETKEIDEKYNGKEAKIKAIKKASDELIKKIGNDSEVLKYRILNEEKNPKEVKLKIFFSVKENITEYCKIEDR